jgi:excisionase family DNA binding protein
MMGDDLHARVEDRPPTGRDLLMSTRVKDADAAGSPALRRYASLEEVAAALTLSKDAVRRMLKDGRLPPARRVGIKLVWPVEEINAFLDKHIKPTRS